MHPQRGNENERHQSTSHTDHSYFLPHASSEVSKHTITKNRYITSSDPRGYIPVYEYPLNGHWLMIDSDNRYILWTSIWKALGNSKADIVKIVEAQPEIASQLRRVRGGYLKIQGTWMPYEVALGLARRVAWPIRNDLIPLFGPTFPSTCLAPDQPGFGQLLDSNPSVRRRTRRTASLGGSTDPPGYDNNNNNSNERGNNTRLEPIPGTSDSGIPNDHHHHHQAFIPTVDGNRSPLDPPLRLNAGGYHSSWTSRSHPWPPQPLPSTPRYSPYPIGERPNTSGFQQTTQAMYTSSLDEVDNMTTANNVRLPPPGSILLPPIPAVFHRPNSLSQQQQQQQQLQLGNNNHRIGGGNLSNRLPSAGVSTTLPPYTLPPISALDGPGVGVEAGFDVLRRLTMDDEGELERNYACTTESSRHANSSGSQWEKIDSDDNRAERSFESSIIPSFSRAL